MLTSSRGTQSRILNQQDASSSSQLHGRPDTQYQNLEMAHTLDGVPCAAAFKSPGKAAVRSSRDKDIAVPDLGLATNDAHDAFPTARPFHGEHHPSGRDSISWPEGGPLRLPCLCLAGRFTGRAPAGQVQSGR